MRAFCEQFFPCEAIVISLINSIFLSQTISVNCGKYKYLYRVRTLTALQLHNLIFYLNKLIHKKRNKIINIHWTVIIFLIFTSITDRIGIIAIFGASSKEVIDNQNTRSYLWYFFLFGYNMICHCDQLLHLHQINSLSYLRVTRTYRV